MESDFPFLGRHALLECSACHPGLPQGDLLSTVARCVDCHQSDFLQVPDPDHVSAGFSTECQDCHQMNMWRPALLEDHEPFFPIFSGEHRGEWTECATCHVTPGSYQDFSCFNCHGHPQDATDAAHPGITGYGYESQACYECHPTGKASPFLDHDPQFFPIYSGSHLNRWDNCANCHVTQANPAVVDCLGCHTNPATDDFHQGFPGYAYISQECLSCHPDGKAGDFVDHEPLFPIFSGKHNGAWQSCGDCHIVAGQRSVFSCVEGCHKHPQSNMDDKHKDESGYVSNGTVCMDCHADGTK